EGGGVLRGKASGCRERRRARTAEAREQIFEPGLRGDQRRIVAGADLGGDSVASLSESLAGNFVLEHVRNGIEVDAGGQMTGKPADVADFKEHAGGEAALDGYVHHVTAADFEIGMVLETQCFRIALIRHDG